MGKMSISGNDADFNCFEKYYNASVFDPNYSDNDKNKISKTENVYNKKKSLSQSPILSPRKTVPFSPRTLYKDRKISDDTESPIFSPLSPISIVKEDDDDY